MSDVTIYHQAVDDRRRELLAAVAQRRLARLARARRASGRRGRAGHGAGHPAGRA